MVLDEIPISQLMVFVPKHTTSRPGLTPSSPKYKSLLVWLDSLLSFLLLFTSRTICIRSQTWWYASQNRKDATRA